MFDVTRLDGSMVALEPSVSVAKPSVIFLVSKRAFDICASLLLLPSLIFVAIFLFFLNPRYNKGRLFYTQKRMGRDCTPFIAIKFRSMTDVPTQKRTAHCPLEVDRITPLGNFIRKCRIDELPQIINVLKGDMSMIGPRPDSYEHALYFVENVAGYRERHAVRPGISGLAQTELGYIEGVEATRRKVMADLYYISNTNFQLEVWIFFRTLAVILRRAGA